MQKTKFTLLSQTLPRCVANAKKLTRLIVLSQFQRYVSMLTLDARNFCTFDTEAGHQPLLIEDEGIGIVFQGC